MRQINIVEGNGKTVKLIKLVAARWEEVATMLHLEDCDIQRIRRDHRNDSCKACQTALKEWLEGEGRNPVTWKTLISALKEAKFSEIASDLEYVLS